MTAIVLPFLVLVCGGRDYADDRRLCATLDRVRAKHPEMWLMHGMARGADSLAGLWAATREVPHIVVPAEWSKDETKKKAGHLRNARMRDLGPNAVVAFPGGAGTRGMVLLAEERSIPVMKVDWQ